MHASFRLMAVIDDCTIEFSPACFGLRAIMDDCAIAVCTSDRSEAEADETRLGGTTSCELGVDLGNQSLGRVNVPV